MFYAALVSAVVAFKASTKGGAAQSALDSAKDAAVVDEGAMGRSTALGVDGLLQLLKNYSGRWWVGATRCVSCRCRGLPERREVVGNSLR